MPTKPDMRHNLEFTFDAVRQRRLILQPTPSGGVVKMAEAGGRGAAVVIGMHGYS
jgi:hypothetical protein